MLLIHMATAVCCADFKSLCSGKPCPEYSSRARHKTKNAKLSWSAAMHIDSLWIVTKVSPASMSCCTIRPACHPTVWDSLSKADLNLILLTSFQHYWMALQKGLLQRSMYLPWHSAMHVYATSPRGVLSTDNYNNSSKFYHITHAVYWIQVFYTHQWPRKYCRRLKR